MDWSPRKPTIPQYRLFKRCAELLRRVGTEEVGNFEAGLLALGITGGNCHLASGMPLSLVGPRSGTTVSYAQPSMDGRL
jgi:hypothetical protein